jgi:PAS domain S-box-containing protein
MLDPFFTNAPDALCVTDLEGGLKQVNRAWEWLLGYGMDELIGRSLFDLVVSEDLPALQTQWQAVAVDRESVRFVYRFRHREQGDRWLDWSWSLSPEKDVVYGIARDVTRQKQEEGDRIQEAEHYRQQLQENFNRVRGEIELRVVERTAELVSSNHRLQQELEERRRVEEVLRFAQARFAGILEIADDAIISVDSRQRIILFNKGAENIFGYSAQEVMNRPLDVLLPFRFADLHRQHVNNFAQLNAQARRMNERGAIYARRKDGGEFPAEASISRLDLPEEDEQVFTVILRDISDRKRAEEELARLSHQNELILNSVGEGLCGLDLQGHITFVNPAAARILGYRIDDLMHQPIQIILPAVKSDGSPYRWIESPIYLALQDGSSQQGRDEMLRRRDGSTFPAEYMVTPIQEQTRIVGAVLTFKNVSDRRLVERMKDEFVSVVSHELRTPLTSIHGSLGMLASGLLSADSERGQRLLQIAVDSTDRLMRLINDILDIERIESGKVTMSKQTCNVADLFQQAVEVMQPMADKFTARLVAHPIPQRLWADPDRIIQTLTNLLSNAIKFSPPEGMVELAAEVVQANSIPHLRQINAVSKTEDDAALSLLIWVKDQGRGIPPEKIDSIFERFQQVDASDSRNHDGTGLGLAICRSIVQQHGGQIWVDSNVGEGSTFYLTLPLPAMEYCAIANPDAPLVLICDDDPGIRTVLKTLLEQREYRVIGATCGREAIEQAVLYHPDVILLDLLMPEMNGWEVMANLKERSDTQDIPIVICSVISMSETPADSSDFVDWLDKPLDEASLLRSLRQALAKTSGPVRVLVVEDDPKLAQVMMTRLERHGIETCHATTGRDAIRESQNFHPDLLILDLVLPDQDGFAVVEWLQQHSSLSHIPLVVYSARDLSNAERDRLTLGQTEFLTKGQVDTQTFEHHVVELLQSLTKAST